MTTLGQIHKVKPWFQDSDEDGFGAQGFGEAFVMIHLSQGQSTYSMTQIAMTQIPILIQMEQSGMETTFMRTVMSMTTTEMKGVLDQVSLGDYPNLQSALISSTNSSVLKPFVLSPGTYSGDYSVGVKHRVDWDGP